MTLTSIRSGLAALCSVILLGACATTDTGQRLAGAAANPEAPDEVGLWRIMDEREAVVQRSPRLNRDPALNAYVTDVMCRVAADYCDDLRVYIIDRPEFNANMGPNGYGEVWAGLLLRAANEDELAFVLAHEAAHFIENHSIERWRIQRMASGLAMGVSVVSVAAGAPEIGEATQQGVVAQLFAYSRDDERQADRLGQQFALEAGYDPTAGAEIWESMIAERAASDDVRNRVALASLYATHPLSRERAATLREAAGSMPRLAARAPDRHLDVIAPHIDAWLDADIAERDFGRSLHLLDQLAKRGLPQSVINLHRGDAYRLRDGEGDAEAALTAYRSAISEPDVPARAYRELGMMLRALGRRPREAAEALRSYLDLDPGAADRAFIEHYIEDLERLS